MGRRDKGGGQVQWVGEGRGWTGAVGRRGNGGWTGAVGRRTGAVGRREWVGERRGMDRCNG